MMSDKQGEKLKIARLATKMPQRDIEHQAQIGQSTISGIENSRVRTIRLDYLYWLAKNGINMSALLNPDVSPEEFSALATLGDSNMLKIMEPKQQDCHLCKEKEDKIEILNRLIASQERFIAALENHSPEKKG